MPDLDIIDRNVPRGWRRPVRILLGEGTPQEVAYEAKIALARSLRENGGLPGLDRLEAILRQRMEGGLDPHSAHVLLTTYENRFRHERHVKVAAAATRRLLVKLDQGPLSRGPLRLAVARAFLRQLLDHNMFGRIGPKLGKHFRGRERADRRAEEGRSRPTSNGSRYDSRPTPAPLSFARLRRLVASVGPRPSSSMSPSCSPSMPPSRRDPRLLRYELSVDEDGCVREKETGAGVPMKAELRVGRRQLQRHFAQHLPSAAADLVDVAAAVYLADRLCRRRPPRTDRYAHHWCRRIHVSVPVRKPEIWNDPEVALALRDLLAFMTEDDWDFSFPGREAPSEVVTGALLGRRPPPPARVVLFSGGLDSFAGLCHELEERPDDHFVLVSGWSHRRLRARQERLRRMASRRIGRALGHLFVEFGLRNANLSYNQTERTQRTRGFLFGCLGAAVALGSGASDLACYENGVGALNLPLTDAQLGAQNSRSAHPVVLHELASLVRVISGRPFAIRLPFLNRTKGEMCRAVDRLGLQAAVRRTVSCDSFPLRERGAAQCGHCTSCLLRRLALGAAGLEARDWTADYKHDVHDLPSWRRHGDDVTFPFAAMRDQVRRLRSALRAPQPWAALVRRYPSLDQTAWALESKGMSVQRFRDDVVRLYDRHCAEWHAVFDQPSLPWSGPPTRGAA